MKTRVLRPNDVGQVVQLLNECFPEKKITEDSFRWKHFAGIYQGGTKCRIAEEGEEIASVVCFTPIKISNSMGRHFYSCAVQATSPNYRRQGLVTQLTKEIEQEFGSEVDYLGFSNRDGVQIDLHSREINYGIIGQFVTTRFSPIFKKNKYQVEEIEGADMKTEGKRFHFYEIQNSKDYISWRFLNHPKNKYTYISIENGGMVELYAVCLSQKKYVKLEKLIFCFDISTSNIEFQAQKTKAIIKAISNYFWSKYRKSLAFSYLPNDFWKVALPRIHVSKQAHIYFTIKTNDISFLSANNWLLQGGDIQ